MRGSLLGILIRWRNCLAPATLFATVGIQRPLLPRGLPLPGKDAELPAPHTLTPSGSEYKTWVGAEGARGNSWSRAPLLSGVAASIHTNSRRMRNPCPSFRQTDTEDPVSTAAWSECRSCPGQAETKVAGRVLDHNKAGNWFLHLIL